MRDFSRVSKATRLSACLTAKPNQIRNKRTILSLILDSFTRHPAFPPKNAAPG